MYAGYSKCNFGTHIAGRDRYLAQWHKLGIETHMKDAITSPTSHRT
jgi:hypothetical protein